MPDTINGAEGAEFELIAVAKPSAGLRASESALASEAGVATDAAQATLNKFNARLRPLFGASEARVEAAVESLQPQASSALMPLSNFYRVEAAAEDLESIQQELLEGDLFEGAYIKPPASPAEEFSMEQLNTMEAVSALPPSTTANFMARQIYLNPAPEGVDAHWAWTQPGGTGAGVHIVDLEGAWRFTHEDLTERQGGVIGGNVINDLRWRNHGTAVIGEYGGDANGFGVKGICHDAVTSAVSFSGIGTAAAINLAASRLSAGDILLLELHRPGPLHNFSSPRGQHGYIAIEWWPDDFAAILNATRRGIIVVEAAGNGSQDLDDDIYEVRPTGFPSSWTNPFRRSNRDSGAIVVGAGAPPPGTHGADHGPDRSRLGFSNFGALIDAQGWGREVTTCGYGDLQGGPDEDLWYTDRFSGTSSASPIVVGVVGCVQGMAKARGRMPFTPAEIKDGLRTTGSPQQDAPTRPATERIGNRPDLPALASALFPAGGRKRPAAFRRQIDTSRPLEIRALIDASPKLTAAYSTTVMQAGLISAQALKAGAVDLKDLAILFRFSDVAGQAIEIMGPIGGDRYRHWGTIAADGLGQLYVDEGFSSTGSTNDDLIAEIQGVETRYAFDTTLQQYKPV
ncbi:MAG: S8 family peptidase [Pseudomonadota bacterium]